MALQPYFSNTMIINPFLYDILSYLSLNYLPEVKEKEKEKELTITFGN